MNLRKIASVIAFIIGAMAIFAGGQVVLLGKVMDYYVIDWLPVYNLTAGLLTFFITAVLIWKNARAYLTATYLTLASHSIIILVLLTAYKGIVASDSIQAMTVRIAVWLIITALLLFDRKKEAAQKQQAG
jgi:hypothetical protein